MLSFFPSLAKASFVLLAIGLPVAAQTASTPPATGFAGCPVPAAITDGDRALANGHPKDAVPLFREAAKAGGAGADKAHDGLIRALLREGLMDDAEADAKAWLAASPDSAWAKVATAEVQWREGKVIDAQNLYQEASKGSGGCVAQLHADFARLFTFTGMHASAAKQIDLAHKLDPQDPTIYWTWVDSQPRAVRLQAVKDELSSDKSLTDRQRKAFEDYQKELEAPKQPASCRVVSPMASSTINFRSMHNGADDAVTYGLDVNIDGKGRRLQIDTGASGIIVYKSVAAALHLEPEHHFKSFGLGNSGTAESFDAKVSHIKIGNVEFADCYVTVVDDSNQRDSSGTKIDQTGDGLIGGDVFSDFIVTLDFPGRQLKLEPLPALPDGATTSHDDDAPPHDRYIAPSMANWTKFFNGGSDIILPVVVNHAKYHLFIVDTGAFDNLISLNAARDAGELSSITFTDIVGISGMVKKTYSTRAVSLIFAGIQQTIPSMTATDTSSFVEYGAETSGFLGARTLHQMTMQVDYRDNLVHFIYDPKRVPRCAANIKQDECF